ncbi:MAG: hypothetical protein V4486_03845 [Patescibacteria group bacterium]
MKTGPKIIVILLVIIIAGGLFYYLTKPAVTENPPVATGDITGCYVAHLAKDVYTLKIDSATDSNVSGMLAFNNFEKDSSSGSLQGTFADNILQGDYSFDSEGMHSDRQVIFKKDGDSFIEGFGPAKVVNGKEVFADPSTITYDPKSTFVKVPDCLERFIDANDTLTLNYNPFFQLIPGGNTPTTEWKANAKDSGTLFARVIIPRTYMPGTNFADANLTVGRATSMNNCAVADTAAGEKNVGSAEVGGFPFTKFTSNGAGAGNFYETTSYRGVVDGDCYAVEYIIHSTNIGNYSPDQGVKEFDKAKIEAELEKIVSSIRFLIGSS